MPAVMSSNSILAGLAMDECIDPGGEVQLLAEFFCASRETGQVLQEALLLLPCQVEWQARGPGFSLYVLADQGADSDQLLAALASFLDGRPGQLRLIETKLVHSKQVARANHGFDFISRGPAGPRDILLASGTHAFGSGNHPSTTLAVDLLTALPAIPSPVLDVGCGTGVLALVAARLGAGRVVGVDIDPEAVRVALENGRLNNLAERLFFTTASLSEVAGPFALILANVTASVLYRLLGQITSQAQPGCRLIVSGLLGRQGEEAVLFAAGLGWRLEEGRSLGKWQARLLRLPARKDSALSY